MSPPWRKHRFLWLMGLVLMGACLPVMSLWLLFPSHGEATPTSKAREPATGDSASQGVVCIGHVDLEQGVAALYPLQPGRVTAVLVRESETVLAGTVLLRLDDKMARLRLAEAQGAIEALELQLTQSRKLPEQQRLRLAQEKGALEAMRQRLSAARHMLERTELLFRNDQISKQELAVSRDHVKEAEAMEQIELKKLAELELHDPSQDMKRLEKELEVGRARLEQARTALDECSIRAPQAGKVLRLLASPGEVLTVPAHQAAVLFAADTPRIVRAEVEQEFAGRITIGQSVVVQDEARANAVWHGKVLRLSDWFTQRRAILQEPFRFNDVRTLECIVQLNPGQPALRIGQRVRVFIGPVTP